MKLPMKRTRPLAEAAEIAALAFAALEPYTRRLVVVGSIRRGARACSDVEIVAEPIMNGDLFGGETPLLDPLIRVCAELGTITKQGARYIQVADIFREEEFNLDLFLCHPPAQWGSLVAIRTGPWQLSRHAVMAMKKRGFKHLDGGVYDQRGRLQSVPDEKSFFSYAGLPFVAPEARTELAHQVGAMG